MFQAGKEIGLMLNKELARALKEEEQMGEKRERFGFLK